MKMKGVSGTLEVKPDTEKAPRTKAINRVLSRMRDQEFTPSGDWDAPLVLKGQVVINGESIPLTIVLDKTEDGEGCISIYPSQADGNAP